MSQQGTCSSSACCDDAVWKTSSLVLFVLSLSSGLSFASHLLVKVLYKLKPRLPAWFGPELLNE